jgi:FKBP-type peptidyl-prolyl cis-trans isomerase FkpA
MNRTTTFLATILAILLASCGGHTGFKRSGTGLYYRFHQQNENGEKASQGDEVTVSMRLYTDDTVFLATGRDTLLSDKILLEEPVYPGDIYEALMMMRTGDSATFILDGNDLFLKFFRMQEIPAYAKDSAEVRMDVRLKALLPKAEVEKKMQAEEEQNQIMLEELKQSEPKRIASIVSAINPSAKPRPSGLYYIETRAGRGPAIKEGSAVTLNYVARLADGKIIETSVKEEAIKSGTFDSLFEYTPFSFIMGDKSTVAGWEEGISCMRRGGKAILVVPSSLAYGEEGLEDLIPPYAPVVYEIEILDVK